MILTAEESTFLVLYGMNLTARCLKRNESPEIIMRNMGFPEDIINQAVQSTINLLCFYNRYSFYMIAQALSQKNSALQVLTNLHRSEVYGMQDIDEAIVVILNCAPIGDVNLARQRMEKLIIKTKLKAL